MNKLALILGCALIIVGCKSSKIITDTEVKTISESEKIITKVSQQKSNFKTLTIQSKISADFADLSGDARATIVINNGSKIWANVTKFGFTGARVLITPDGFEAYEKLGKTYYQGDFSEANKLLKVDFIDYQKLQNLLLGKVFVDFNTTNYTATLVDNQYQIKYNIDNQQNNSTAAGQYIQNYNFDTNFRLKEAFLKDPVRKIEVTITYSNWVKNGNDEFPKNVKIIIKEKKTRQIDLEYNSFTYQETNTPFAIPSGYKKKEIK